MTTNKLAKGELPLAVLMDELEGAAWHRFEHSNFLSDSRKSDEVESALHEMQSWLDRKQSRGEFRPCFRHGVEKHLRAALARSFDARVWVER
jgi:hypothetical protein